MSTRREWDGPLRSPGYRTVYQRIVNVLQPTPLPVDERTPLPAKGGLKAPTTLEAILRVLLPRNLSDNKPLSAAARAREKAANAKQARELADALARAKSDPRLEPLTNWSEEKWFQSVRARETRAFGTRTTINPTDFRSPGSVIVKAGVRSWEASRPPVQKGGRPPKDINTQAGVETRKLERALKRAAEGRVAAAVRPQGPVGQGGVTDEAWDCYLLTRPPAGVGLLSIEDAANAMRVPMSRRKAQHFLDQVKQALRRVQIYGKP